MRTLSPPPPPRAMVNTNATDPVNNSSNPARVDEPQPAVQTEKETTAKPSHVIKAAVQAEVEAAPEPSPTTGAGNPGLSQPAPAASFQQSSRVWRSGEPYYPSKPTNSDGEHWKKVYEKAEQFDTEFCKGWNSEIDALLTFAGLFSAVVTAFAVESYKLLQPDPQDITNRILLNVSAQLAGGDATELPSGFTPSPSSLRINVLWFLSLTFSLTAGLVGILCKQWLRHYQQDISKPPREALAIRQFRYDAFLRCRVMDILSALPILLGLGLILFFVGLIDFLQGLNAKVSIPVTVLIGVGFAFLVVTTSAPAFQYAAVIRHYSLTGWYISQARPALFAFKSPQSLAILHCVTWLYPPSTGSKLPSWTSLELTFFSNSILSSALHNYIERALTWLDETYSHSLDVARQICLCLQDTEGDLTVEDLNEAWLPDLAMERSSAAVIRSLFNTTRRPGSPEAVGHVRRDIIAMRYLCSLPITFDQLFAVLEHLIRALNSSQHHIHSLEPFGWMFSFSSISLEARNHPAEQLQEVMWQRVILFRNLVSEGRWGDSAGIPWEVQYVCENLRVFTDEDLDSIFNVLRIWMDQHSQGADLPSHFWVALVSQFKPHELDEALRHRPPVRDFMAFLDSRFQMDEGVRYLCEWHLYQEDLDPFFTALYAWIRQNPQDMQSFILCQTLITTIYSRTSGFLRGHQSLRDFEVFLEAQIARNGGIIEQGSICDP